jgi:hypothetical protein
MLKINILTQEHPRNPVLQEQHLPLPFINTFALLGILELGFIKLKVQVYICMVGFLCNPIYYFVHLKTLFQGGFLS